MPNKVITEIILLDHLDKSLEYDQKYYCANIIEGTFECSNQLTYVKGDRFGFNYRYCRSCYAKWNALEKEKQVNKYYAPKPSKSKPKAQATITDLDPFDD